MIDYDASSYRKVYSAGLPAGYLFFLLSSSFSKISPRQQMQKGKEKKNQCQAQSLEYSFFGRSPLFVPCSIFPARPQASRCWICLWFRPLKAPRPRIWHPIFRPLSEAARDAVAVARGLLALMRLMKGRWAIVEIPWSRTIGESFFFLDELLPIGEIFL